MILTLSVKTVALDWSGRVDVHDDCVWVVGSQAGNSVVQNRNRADCHPSNRPCSAHACAGPCNKPLRWASVVHRHDPGWEDQSSPVNGRRRRLSRLSTGRSDLWCLALHLCSRLRSVSVCWVRFSFGYLCLVADLSTDALAKARLKRWRRRARRWINRIQLPRGYPPDAHWHGPLPSPCRRQRCKLPLE